MTTNTTKPILLDGGMGQELIKRGAKWQYGAWAVAALYEQPETVQAIHEDYIRAGADVITTNSYGTTRMRLRHANIEERFAELHQIAGQLANAAREATGASSVRIAASLPPLESSYISAFAMDTEAMVAEYRDFIALLDPYVDIFLAETLATVQEAQAVLTAARESYKPLWLSWTLNDHGATTLRSGEPLSDALASLPDDGVDAVLLNCTTPDSIAAALPILQASGRTYGAYANGFVEIPQDLEIADDGVQHLEARTDLSPAHYTEHVREWLVGGATIVGGCCEVGPDHIAAVRAAIRS